MIDDGSIDTLERPVRGKQRNEQQADLNRDAVDAEWEERQTETEGSREEGEQTRQSGFHRLRALMQVAGGNARNHIHSFRVILSNRRKRKHIAIPDLPSILKPQNVAALLIALCGVAMVFLDHSSPIWARRLPDAYHSVFDVVTDAGKSDWVLIPTGLWILAVIFRDWQANSFRRKMIMSSLSVYASFLFFVVAASGLLAIALKWNIGRARPSLFDEMGPLAFEPFAWQAKLSSLPSGHSTTAGALIVALALLAPKYRWFIVVVGSWIAVSRIIVGAHYPSDVAAGLVVGGVFSYLSARWMARRRLGFRYSSQGELLPTLTNVFSSGWLRALSNTGNTRAAGVHHSSEVS
ncbi:phosphatase PAP2 family protein [Pseudovibrio sp. JE062]|uniref:phosphatase PAP2 family protein n=1 Tax=Pseudovibrio sp. JE062 TaxID=439495 RepID=UPI000186B8CB|nr:phosphatase PAP2 family protein [Pseudovibrio sp. JE062]EEA96787.1 putative phosphatase protein [Pseudovibrio sp. JE062]